MTRIYRTTDRIPVKVDTLTVTISPLSFDQKTELQSIMMQATKDPLFAVRGARLAIKYAVKDVQGLEDADGPYKVTLGEDGNLTDACVDDLLNTEENPKLITLCSTLIAGVPKQVIDPMTKKPMDGISFPEGPKLPKQKARK